MLYFATYFDINYLSRGLILYNSLINNCSEFKLYILCLDINTFNFFTENSIQYPNITLLTLEEIEEFDISLREAKKNRSKVEYFFTLSPCLPLYLLKKYNLAHICTLDADILFMSSPASIFNYLNEYSIIITPHKFSIEIKNLEAYGKYNVSFQIFKNDENGILCLEQWRTQCLEWCGDIYDEINDRFADQKYLDNWENDFPGKVKKLDDEVCGLAPWNLNNFKLEHKNGIFYSNGIQIIFYHFHHFKILHPRIATNGFSFYKVHPSKTLIKLYNTYWNQLNSTETKIGINNNRDSISRTHLSSNKNLIDKLNDEGAAFLRISKNIIIFANFQKLSGRIYKFIFRLYA